MLAVAAVWVFGAIGASGVTAAGPAAVQPLGILPASVIRNESTLIPAAVLPDFKPQGWAGLVCGPVRCELRPIKLALLGGAKAVSEELSIGYVRADKREPVPGERTLVLLRGFALAPGVAVPTWFTLRTPRVPQDAASGSMGVTILGPGRSAWQIVPRWNATGNDGFLTYYLDSKEQGAVRRQALGRISMEAVHTGVNPKDLLIWAGDLDGDGKIDLITRTGPKSSQPGLQLWLSTRAEEGDLVGPAARLEAWADIEEAIGC